MALYKTSETSALVGKVVQCQDGIINIDIYKRERGKFVSSGQQITCDITKCLPGSFPLTNSGNIPQNISSRLSSHGIILDT